MTVEELENRERERYQLDRLNAMVKKAAEKTEFYDDLEVTSLDSLDEVSKLPLTTKSDLREVGYESTLIRGPDEIMEYHTSSGTTGEPSVLAMTETDLERSRRALARTWRLHGISEDDLVQMMVSYGLYTAGLLNQYAIQELGAGVVPSGIQSTERQLEQLSRFEPDYLVCVSSYYLRIIHVLEERGLEIPDVDGLVGGGVPVTEKMKRHIESHLDAPFYNQYGLAEVDTGLAGECECQNGLHIQADYVYPEIVDPETHEPLEEGEEGLLVLTPLQRDGQALLRYLTNDITSIRYDRCECGRTLPRIDDPRGRADDVVFVKGTKLNLTDFQRVLEEIDDLINPFNWQLEIDHEHGKDTLELRVQWRVDEPHGAQLERHVRNATGFTVDRIVSTDGLVADPEEKHERLVDTRPDV